MQRKLTITIADEVYRGLHERSGRGEISRFIECLVRPHVVDDHDLEAAYCEMAADEEREREASEWIEFAPGEGLERGAARSTGSTLNRRAAGRSARGGRPSS